VPKCKSGLVRRKIDGKCHVKCRPGQIIGPSGRCIKKPKKVKSGVGSGGSGVGSGSFGGSGVGSGGSGSITSRGFAGLSDRDRFDGLRASRLPLDDPVAIWASGGPFPATPSGYRPPPGLSKGIDIPAHSRKNPYSKSEADDLEFSNAFAAQYHEIATRR
jgi:hypothetical protein